MREGQVFNGKIIQNNWSINDFLKNNWGVSKGLKHIFVSRFEYKNYFFIRDLNNYQWWIFLNFLYKVVPVRTNLKKRCILNLYMLDLINCYRGWRHYKGLPVRGQRTWSNASTAARCNILLRNYRVKMSRRCYGNLPLTEVSIALAAEQINLTWKIQWFDEWLSAKRNRLGFRGAPNQIKIDLYSMARGQIMNPMKYNKMSKKQRQSFKKNHFSLGFDPGFTKPLLTELYKSRIDPDFKSNIQSQLLFKKYEQKRTKSKKKIDVKAKVIAHAAKKKKKKSVWDL